jgi:hypothetical protein
MTNMAAALDLITVNNTDDVEKENNSSGDKRREPFRHLQLNDVKVTFSNEELSFKENLINDDKLHKNTSSLSRFLIKQKKSDKPGNSEKKKRSKSKVRSITQLFHRKKSENEAGEDVGKAIKYVESFHQECNDSIDGAEAGNDKLRQTIIELNNKVSFTELVHKVG